MQTLNNSKLLSLYYMMNQYSLINVCKKTHTKTTSFAINGIIVFHNNPTNIGFTRTFATDYIPEDFVADIQELDNSVIISCGEEQYILSPIQSKGEYKECMLSEKFPIDSLISKQYVDESLVEIKNNTVYLPVSVIKLGKMNRFQKKRMQYLIDNVLEGSSAKYQFCRVPAFSIEFVDNDFILYGHIYDLLYHTYTKQIELYNSRYDFSRRTMFLDFVTYAKSLAIRANKNI